MSEKKEDTINGKVVKLNYVYPDNLQSNFITSLIVQHEPNFFTLSFFEIFAPPILGESDEEKKAIINSINQVNAKCVSRIIVTPEKMKEIVKVMSDNLKSYEAKQTS